MREVFSFIEEPFFSVLAQIHMNGTHLGDKTDRLFLGAVNDCAETVLSKEYRVLLELDMKKRNMLATAMSHPVSFARLARAKLKRVVTRKSKSVGGRIRSVVRRAKVY
jgi:hypothetical protein